MLWLVLDLIVVTTLLMLAWLALFSRSLFAGVVFFVCFGLLLAVAWARLQAPDVALAEAAIGAGLTGALLLVATRRIEPAERRSTVSESRHDQD